jgi:hypothetical protein
MVNCTLNGGRRTADFPFNTETVTALYEAGVPSPHGEGKELVYDQTYRQAHELKVSRFDETTSTL